MKLAEVSVRHPVFAAAMSLVLILLGAVAYPNIGVDLFPKVDVPVVTVTVVYPGADPSAVESKVIDKLEDALNTISGIDKLRSTSLENVGQVVVVFDLERDVDVAAQDVRDKVSNTLPDLPSDIDPPRVEKFDVGAAPILTLALAGDASAREISRVADDVVKARLESIDGVGSIEIVGRRDREIHVWINRDRLASYGLTVPDVAKALGAQNMDVPAGRIDVGAEELMVKAKGEARSAEELGALVIMSVRGAPVRVRDVARVVDSEEEARTASVLDARRAVTLVVQKQSDANTVAVATAVKAAVKKIELPKGMTLAIPSDNSLFIQASMEDVRFDLLFGGILTVLIIMLFLRDLRITLIASVALPTSVIATVAFISMMGFTFNNMTMLALTLSVGILIDDAIVVVENIHRHLEMGKSAREAALDATAEIGLAVMAITASIIAVFVPVAMMEGIVGRFFYQFGLTVSFAVAVSLFVSFTLTPMLSSRILKAQHNQNALSALIERFLVMNEEGYARLLKWVVHNRLITGAIALAAFAGAVVLAGQLKSEFLPSADNGEFNISFELPPGRNLAETEAFAAQLAGQIKDLPGVVSLLTRIGDGADGQVNKGSIHVQLVDKHGRNFTTKELIDYTRALLGTYRPARVAVEEVPVVSGGGSRPQMVQFNIRGQDPSEVKAASEQIMGEMARLKGFVDIDSTDRSGKPEVLVHIDRGRAAELNVPVAVVAQSLRLLVAGDKVTDIPDGRGGSDRIDVRVRLRGSERKSVADLSRIKVRSTTGSLVELANIVTIERGLGPARIDRQARMRQTTILANLDGKTLGTAIDDIDGLAKSLPGSLTTDWAGNAEMSGDAATAMGQAMFLAVGLIYLLLASQFNSWLHPITIMLSLPLSFVGAFGAMWLTGSTMNIFSMVGMIMLMGLVIKNAVLLIDFALAKQREEGLSPMDSILAAGPVRLRPILMTSAAMIFGMIPVALGHSLGGEQRAPMAIAVIGGLFSSTFLTLLVVPVVYLAFDGLRTRIFGHPEEEPASPPKLASDPQ